MRPWRILLVNATLANRTGTETALRDLALGLRAAGQQPMVYAPRLGEIALELSAAGIAVTSDLRQLPAAPDIVHGNHHAETIEALLHFPGTRGLFVCHDRTYYMSAPPRLARIGRYVAVDANCLERLVVDYAIPEELTRVIYNAVDTVRFPQRGPLPPSPMRAAVFSNYAGPGTHLDAVQMACARLNLPLDVIGATAGASSSAPEDILGCYDLVFAKARCALEAMASGAAVILCDAHGVGSMVTSATLPGLRPWNFGRRLLRNWPNPETITAQIHRYDANDARAVSNYIREHATLARCVEQYQQLYDELMAEPAPPPLPAAKELDDYVRSSATRVHELETALAEFRRPYRMEPLADDAAKQISIAVREAPSEVPQNSPFQVTVDLQNDSAHTLGSYPPHPLHIAYRWLPVKAEEHGKTTRASSDGADEDKDEDETETPTGTDGPRTHLRPTLLPGACGKYAVHVIAPPDAGRYCLRLTLVQESVMWLDQLPTPVCADVTIDVRKLSRG